MPFDMGVWIDEYTIHALTMIAAMFVCEKWPKVKAKQKASLGSGMSTAPREEAEDIAFWKVGETSAMRLICRSSDGAVRRRKGMRPL